MTVAMAYTGGEKFTYFDCFTPRQSKKYDIQNTMSSLKSAKQYKKYDKTFVY